MKTSIPNHHISVALFQALDCTYNAPNNLIIKCILEKRFSMAI